MKKIPYIKFKVPEKAKENPIWSNLSKREKEHNPSPTTMKEYCLRCGLTKKEAYYEGGGCSAWGDYWKRHMWQTLPEGKTIDVGQPSEEKCTNCIDIEGLKECKGHKYSKPSEEKEVAPKQNGWEDELDEKFTTPAYTLGSDEKLMALKDFVDIDALKSFIRNLLKDERGKVIKD